MRSLPQRPIAGVQPSESHHLPPPTVSSECAAPDLARKSAGVQPVHFRNALRKFDASEHWTRMAMSSTAIIVLFHAIADTHFTGSRTAFQRDGGQGNARR